MYLGECTEAVAGVVFYRHFKINRPLEEDGLKIKKRTRGRPAKVITGRKSKDETHKVPKNRAGGIPMAPSKQRGRARFP